ncbi:hypothetical protein GE061_018823 [Apolygus lucorum]|uniref:Uncharacterized protein n=1 Tax=Apolygus lucorum TaxID=248454 RepID=A0A8S9X6R8_APOLU|nr:hypothetical protein GE061_018823 [Apolygus lucorum]
MESSQVPPKTRSKSIPESGKERETMESEAFLDPRGRNYEDRRRRQKLPTDFGLLRPEQLDLEYIGHCFEPNVGARRKDSSGT